jgi:nucleotide-binding universal stress UspA family protein
MPAFAGAIAMTKLLVPFDGSDAAMRALRHAVFIVKTHEAGTIHVVNAHDEPDMYGEIAAMVPREKMAEIQRQASEARLAVAEKVLQAAGVAHSKEVLVGPAAQVIAQRADELGCDGIVMGTRGMSALGGLVMGSVANKVVHAAKVPVTLVK